jgi:hypothetical protein
MAFAELDRAASNAVQEGGSARVAGGPTTCQHCRASASRSEQAFAQLLHLGLLCSCQDDPERVEQHQLGVLLHCRGDLCPLRLGDKLR